MLEYRASLTTSHEEEAMGRRKEEMVDKEELFVGIDLHKQRWHVTIRTFDVEVFSASIPGTWEALQRVLARYHGHPRQAVYEVGYFGFRLHIPPADDGQRSDPRGAAEIPNHPGCWH